MGSWDGPIKKELLFMFKSNVHKARDIMKMNWHIRQLLHTSYYHGSHTTTITFVCHYIWLRHIKQRELKSNFLKNLHKFCFQLQLNEIDESETLNLSLANVAWKLHTGQEIKLIPDTQFCWLLLQKKTLLDLSQIEFFAWLGHNRPLSTSKREKWY